MLPRQDRRRQHGGGEGRRAAGARDRSLDYIKSKFGASDEAAQAQSRRVREGSATSATAPDGKDHSDFLWLFSPLVGCYTASGRVRAVPGAGASFVTNCLEEIARSSLETNLLPNNVKTPEERGMKAGKNSALVGHIGLVAAEKWLERKAFPALGLAPGGALDNEPLRACVVDVLRRSALSYQAVVGEAGGDLTVAKLTTCAELLVLVANPPGCDAVAADEHVARRPKRRPRARDRRSSAEGGCASDLKLRASRP